MTPQKQIEKLLKIKIKNLTPTEMLKWRRELNNYDTKI
jgi:hypothetical protein